MDPQQMEMSSYMQQQPGQHQQHQQQQPQHLNHLFAAPHQLIGQPPQLHPFALGPIPSISTQTNGTYQRPAGLTGLLDFCANIYQNQIPICESTGRSFVFHGGDQPLDFVYIFRNEGNNHGAVPRHWHYVGFGLSDLHCYQLLCDVDSQCRSVNPIYANTAPSPPQLFPPRAQDREKISGFGFELTFRIKCHENQNFDQPPKWPIDVMQSLAKYVFRSKNVFSDGDHISWRRSLDHDESDIQHMLMTLDPQLGEVQTQFGKVKFIQLVGVCQEELQAARAWNVAGILNLMKGNEATGGEYLVTDMKRCASLFQIDPESEDRVRQGREKKGSDMAMISARHKYSSRIPRWFQDTESLYLRETDNNHSEDEDDVQPCASALRLVERGNQFCSNREESTMSVDQYPQRTPSRMSSSSHVSESGLRVENLETVETRFYDNMYLLLEYESAKVLPVVIQESLVCRERPFQKQGPMLQIYISNELRRQMWQDIREDFGHTDPTDESRRKQNSLRLPKNYSWPEFKFHITVVKEIRDTQVDVDDKEDDG